MNYHLFLAAVTLKWPFHYNISFVVLGCCIYLFIIKLFLDLLFDRRVFILLFILLLI